MGSDSEDDDGKEDQAAAINNIVQPIRKQMKKLSSKLDKMAGLVKALEEERDKEKEAREMSEKQLAETKESTRELQMKLDAAPWKLDGERFESLIKATDASLRNILDEQRVQVAAHSQVFASTQSTVSDISQKQATLSAENHDHTRRAAEELRTINARLDHMRGEFSERVTHTFEEGTKHADRLGARLQEDLHRLDQEVSLRASAKSVGESTAALRSELAEVKSTNDELRRDLRSNQVQLQELRDGQQNYVTKSSVSHAAREEFELTKDPCLL
jgi:chromosome segregation ATPase